MPTTEPGKQGRPSGKPSGPERNPAALGHSGRATAPSTCLRVGKWGVRREDCLRTI